MALSNFQSNYGSLEDVDFAREMSTGDMTPASITSPKGNYKSKSLAIDYQKYKSKLCRNYLMGVPCPFEDRCAFAHGETQVTPAPENQVNNNYGAYDEEPSSPAGEMASPPPPAYTEFMADAVNASAGEDLGEYTNEYTNEGYTGEYTNEYIGEYSGEYMGEYVEEGTSTPTYSNVSEDFQFAGSRFRYDPYVKGGIVFSN